MSTMQTDPGHAPDHDVPLAPRSPAARRGPWRWLVAGSATLLLVVSGSGLIAFAQTGAGAGQGPAFVPAGAPIYLEARVDMPSGQDEALAEMLTAFPGFADSASFRMRLDEALDDMIGQATDGELDWSQGISPWITGELGLAVTGLSEAVATGEDPDLIAGIGVSDPAGAAAFIDLVAEEAGDMTEEVHAGVTILVDDDAAVALTDEFLLIGSSADLVKRSIDVLAGTEPSLVADEDFQASFSRVPPGHLGALWMDVSAFADLVEAAMDASGQTGPAAMTETLLAQLPRDMTMYLAAAPNGLTVEAFIRPAEGGMVATPGESDLALRFPAGTQLYVEARDLGASVTSGLEGVMATVESDAAEDIEAIEGLLGAPIPEFLDFVEDAAIGAAVDSDGAWLGMAAEVSDPEVAAERVDRLLGLIGVMAASEDADVEITESEVAGATVTTISLPIDDSTMPVDVGDSLSVAIAGDDLLLGTGEFVSEALTADAGSSLGMSEGFTSALEGATSNTGLVFADIGGLLATLDPLLALAIDDWEEISPWLAGLDRFVAVGTADADVISARMTLYVD